MPLTLVTTPGSATANSYASVAETTAYALEAWPVDTTWAMADPDDQKRALIHASRVLDTHRFAGDRATVAQALAWPRLNVLKQPDADTTSLASLTVNTAMYDGSEIPEPVKRAHAALARFLIAKGTDTDPFAADGSAGVSSIALGGELSVSYDAATASISDGTRFLATVVRPILRHLVRTHQPKTVRG